MKNLYYLYYLNYLILFSTSATGIITNLGLPVCKNCIHFMPYNNDISSPLGKCKLYGDKNIITGEISHSYVDNCRKDETKCGLEGNNYELDPNLKSNTVINNIKYCLTGNNLLFLFILSFFVLEIKLLNNIK